MKLFLQSITGIALPFGSDKLFSASKDGSIRVWDCNTGKCVETVDMGGEVGCIITEGPWIFIGVANAVKVWNTQTSTGFSLNEIMGQVNALAVKGNILFAGTQDGRIVGWKFNSEGKCVEPPVSLDGHQQSVAALVISSVPRLYSASMDHTIKVWDLTTLQCIQTLNDHPPPVTSLIYLDEYILSGSLDRTIKVWGAGETGKVDVICTRSEEHGVVALRAMHAPEAKPVLCCSCDDNSVRLYDLPSFNTRGMIFSKEEVRSIETCQLGLFFTGDGAGQLKVWKLSAQESEAPPASKQN